MKILITSVILLIAPFRLLAAETEYEMSDICRATLNTMLNRDISIMKATQLADGSARVQFTRPQDGKNFSYRCRSTEGQRIGILDETISGPRWYGEQPTDMQRSFKIDNGTLAIRSFSSVSSTPTESFYSHTDFNRAAQNDDETSKELAGYSTDLAVNYAEGKLRFIKAYHVDASPLNAYRVDFESAAKELQSLPGGDEDDNTYRINSARVQAWQSRFCSSEIMKLMQKKQIAMISGFVLNGSKSQIVAVCMKA